MNRKKMKKAIFIGLFISSSLFACNGNTDKPMNKLETQLTNSPSTKVASIEKTEQEDWTGTYQETSATLTIKGPASDGAIQFVLKQGGNCAEEPMEGTAYLTNQTVANWQEEGGQCHLSFTYNSGSIQVIETDCMHGASCGTYDGFYNKKK
jgi:hypothetical protein